MPSGARRAADSELAKFVRFCAALRLENGKPLELEPYQLTLLGDYFDGVIETVVLLPKKNGKTTLLGALALFHLTSTPDAECVIGAASRDQASILYEQAVGFVKRTPKLQERVVVRNGYRAIMSKAHSGRIRVLAADVDTADGIIPTLALVDELHRHKSGELYGIFRDGLGPRHGRMITISTAGDHERSTLGVIRSAARKLPGIERDGKHLHVRTVDDSFAMHEWALEREDDTRDLRLVKQVNPASWHTEEQLAQRLHSPTTTPWQWDRFACGIWTGAESWWVKPDDWDDSADDEASLRPGDTITLGFDGSRYHDATALVGCRVEDGLVQLLGLWESPKGVRDWEVPAGAVDAAVARAHSVFRVARGYYDPPLWQTEIDGWARDFGDAVVRYPTNRSRFMAALERFRTDVASRSVPHTGDVDLTRHVLAAQIREARGGYWLEKPTSIEHIDAAIAAVLAYEARCDVAATEIDRGEYAFL